jgi:hypothetical protein
VVAAAPELASQSGVPHYRYSPLDPARLAEYDGIVFIRDV